jgi:UDP-N-acetylglucosamine--N-acetylmuramyl-(pentapeptide) pyrophosphoryl-undecaprenol N-acetylglucosamine transferase
MVAFFQSFYWLFVYRPKVIISFGGYLSVPVVFSGFIQSIPIVSHEQTLNLGLSNKINAFFSKKMCVSWPSVLKRIKGDNIVLTGLPLRSAILKPESHEIYSQLKKENLPIVFITGGNQGSHFINNLVKDALAELLVGYVLIHQVGVSEKYHDLQKIEEEIRKLPGILQKRYIIKQHFSPDEIGGIYLVSDIVVGRSGINTVSELLYLKKKAILIPLPFSAAKEQQENAKLLEGAGLAIVLNQYQTSKKTLIETLFKIQSLKINTRVYVEYENLFPKASKKIADEIWQLIK